ncbi:sulfate ABC transporter permease subunit CysT, partial [Escherichia coli]|nr:sulfate ABC transporter permease subunit CysT [Escherichia coli]
LLYFAIIVALPLLAMLYKSVNLGWSDFWTIISSERAVATYQITIGAALLATLFNALFGLLLAWVLVRYEFPGRRLLDA